MILFAINTGLRTNDVFNLKWEDIDLEQRSIKLITGKNRKVLAIPMNDTAFGIVQHRQKHGPYVFYNPMTGDPLLGCCASLGRCEACRLSDHVTWHVFRHTFASRLTRSGVDIVTVKELLGHSNISVTMRYAHSNQETKRNAVQRITSSSDRVVAIVPRTKKAAV